MNPAHAAQEKNTNNATANCNSIFQLMEISPLAPPYFPQITSVAGLRLAATQANIKYSGRDDLMLVGFDKDVAVAGVFTRSATASAPVQMCQRNLVNGVARGLIVNSGNANAFTGRTGDKHCVEICDAVANSLGCEADLVFIASTGVIGEPLPNDRILAAIPNLSDQLDSDNWEDAANAILTTDTFAKASSIATTISGCSVTISGFAKGSGMIEPDMATMLGFVFTDANIPPPVLQKLLVEANQQSFNSITVDSDTSTSDTCLLFATGGANNPLPKNENDKSLDDFKQGLQNLMLDLAQQVVRDGEGATKFIQVSVSGAEHDSSAKVIAKAIANSPLVKTAIAGEDANWGRVVMAVGKSGERADRDKLEISIGGVLITENGQVVADYDESRVSEHLETQDILIEVDVGIGPGVSTVWTCDLTHGYITINADYRS